MSDKHGQDGESRYRTIYESAAVSICVTDLGGNIIDSNPAYRNMLGYSAQELSKMRFRDFTAAEDLHDNLALFEQLISGERQRIDFEKRYIRKDGTICWVEMSSSVLRDPSGAAEATLSVVHDVTERKLAQQALDISEEKYRNLFDNAHDSILVIDPADLTIIDANENAAWRLGYSKEELRRLKLRDIYPADESERMRSTMQQFLDQGEIKFEAAHVRKDGTQMPVEVTSRRIEIAGRAVIQSFVRDISERTRAEDALRESEQNLSGIMANIADSVVTIDEAGTILSFNKAAEQAFGYRAEEMIGCSVERLMSERFAKRHHEYMASYFESGRSAILGKGPRELEGRRKDGSTFALELTISEMRIDERRTFIGAMRDITERIQVEEQLRQAQKMEAVGQLTGGIAHDFNNLLAVMIGSFELLRDEVEADRSLGAMIDRGVKAAERGAALTDRLLAFSRKHTLAPTSLDLNKLVAEMAELLGRTLGGKIEIRPAKGQDLWPCHADQAQLENALLNLSINARDAMPDGGRLTIETKNISLSSRAAAARIDIAPGNYVMLGVSDSGNGIAKETLKHVFEPFFTTKEVGKGTGLGLSMVHGFAKQSGGSVTIESELGVGTDIKLYLPCADGQDEKTQPGAAASNDPLAQDKRQRLPIVEKDAAVPAPAADSLAGLG